MRIISEYRFSNLKHNFIEIIKKKKKRKEIIAINKMKIDLLSRS